MQLEDSGSSASSGTSPVERLMEFSNEDAMAIILGQLEHQVENGTASQGAFEGMLSQTKGLWLIWHVAYARCLITVFIDLVIGSE